MHNHPDDGPEPGWPAAVHTGFPDATFCVRANAAARFLPLDGPDTLLCLEVAGTQAYLYVDPATATFCVSVDLDTTEEQFVRPDGTVPQRIAVQGRVVFDDGNVAESNTATRTGNSDGEGTRLLDGQDVDLLDTALRYLEDAGEDDPDTAPEAAERAADLLRKVLR